MRIRDTLRSSLPAVTVLAAVAAVYTAVAFCRGPATGNSPTARPILYIPQATREVECPAPLERQVVPFVIENRGTRRLLVNQHGCSSCGSNQEEQTVIIRPGSSGTLLVSIEPNPSGERLVSRVNFDCNDPLCPRFQLTVIGRVANN